MWPPRSPLWRRRVCTSYPWSTMAGYSACSIVTTCCASSSCGMTWRQPRLHLAPPPLDDHKLICRRWHPGPDFPVRPLDAHLRATGCPQTEMRPAKLTARVTAADSQLAPQRGLADLDLNP